MLDNNADVELQDKDVMKSLAWAVYKDNELVVRLLLDHNADVNLQDEDGMTALAWAVKKGYKAVVQLLEGRMQSLE